MVVEKVGNELRFKNPGSLLMIVLGFAFWGVGFLDLLGHKSADPDVFGLYSLPFFIMVVLYGLTISVWFALFFNSNLLTRVAEGIKSLQNNTSLAILTLLGLAVSLWLIFEWDRWSRLPMLQFAAFGLLTLASIIFLLANWIEKADQQKWRKIIAYPVAVLLVLEIVLQLLARYGTLPAVEKLGGHFYPYERIYQSGKIVQNDFANRYGWYYLDNNLDTKQKHILMVGGSYVRGFEVQPEQQASAILTTLIDEGQTELSGNVDMIPIGLPGFGLSPFLFEDAMREMPTIVNADEMIVMFHLGDDFQSPARADNAIEYVLTETNETEVDPDDARIRHDLTHYYLRGYMSFQLVGTIRSNYLTPKVILALVNNSPVPQRSAFLGDDEFDFSRVVGHVSASYTLTEPGHAGIKTTDLDVVSRGNNFMFTQGGNDDMRESVLIADNLLKRAQEIALERGLTLRVVTIPMYPDVFYQSFEGGNWQPEVSGYDLFLPERALVAIAQENGISILPMGQYMFEDKLTVEQIRELYLSGNAGAFTPAGHMYFAEAIYSCFYSNAAGASCPK